ncbi:hypothetical protein C9374_009336 [Naegleria lovaniensis]|uniref:F-box domain-containing protein n=1 Tax=Naegleria lovaniensis TaxID=51637 RepID=A0AA88KF13_NAELO|nr:uncharacterized protein C9374_009336 [Naegleria lovaniensis]KAG2377425.1 hypothetical protein C9374_009336 [Naegleria lovaniensis]
MFQQARVVSGSSHDQASYKPRPHDASTPPSLVFYLNDILYHIFSYSLLPIVQFRYSLVCKHWYEFSNSSLFYKNYQKDFGGLGGSLVNPKHSDIKKYLFDWVEFVEHLYPQEYNTMQLMRPSMSIEDFSKLSNSEIELKFTKPFQEKFFQDYWRTIKRSKLITMDNGSGKRVSFFTFTHGSDVIHFAFVDSNGDLLNIDSKFANAKQHKQCYLYYEHYTDSLGISETDISIEGSDWFCNQFKPYVNVLGRGLFLSMMEFVCLFGVKPFKTTKKSSNSPHQPCYMYEMRTNISLSALKDKPHPMRKQAHHIHHKLLSNSNSLLQKALVKKDSHWWYRLLNAGYTIPVTSLETLAFDHHFDSEHVQFFYAYCDKHDLKQVAMQVTRARVVSLLSKGKSFIEQLCSGFDRFGLSDYFPREVCSTVLCDQATGIPNYDLIDCLKMNIRNDFYCPFDLRNVHEKQEITVKADATRILFLFESEKSQQEFSQVLPQSNPLLSKAQVEYRYLSPQLLQNKDMIWKQSKSNGVTTDIACYCVNTITKYIRAMETHVRVLKLLKNSKEGGLLLLFIFKQCQMNPTKFNDLFGGLGEDVKMLWLPDETFMLERFNSAIFQ